jgi:hypothetical protein
MSCSPVFFFWSHPELVEVLTEMQMFKRLVTDKGIVSAFLSNNSIHKQAPPPSVAQGSFQLLISQHRMKFCYAHMLVVGSSSSNRQILLNRLQIRFRLHISTPQIKFFLLAVLAQFLFQQRHYMSSPELVELLTSKSMLAIPCRQGSKPSPPNGCRSMTSQMRISSPYLVVVCTTVALVT